MIKYKIYKNKCNKMNNYKICKNKYKYNNKMIYKISYNNVTVKYNSNQIRYKISKISYNNAMIKYII